MTVHILPTLPPERNGLADYAYKLYTHWPDPADTWHALVLHVPSGAEKAWPGLTIDRTVPNSADLLKCLKALSPQKVVLHYVPHGYEGNGNPKWLIDGLTAAKQELNFSLFTIFHELYVVPRRLGRSTLYQRPSKVLFRRLLALSDRWSTSTDAYWEIIRAQRLNDRGLFIPIGTNVEPKAKLAVEPTPDRWRLALFGLADTRMRTLQLHAQFVQRLSEARLIEAIYDIGSAPSAPSGTGSLMKTAAADVQVHTVHDADERTISEALSLCHIGLCYNSADVITKSGVFAAYCAHGVAPILPPSPPGAKLEGPWLLTNSGLPLKEDVDSARRRALSWGLGEGSWEQIAQAVYKGIEASCR